MKPGSISNAMQNKKVFWSLSYSLVFLMMTCVILTISTLLQSIVPAWHAGIIAGIVLFVLIDRLYTYPQLKSLIPLSSEWALSIGAQWIVIVLVSRLLLSYANGLDSFLNDLSLFTRGYVAKFFNAELIVELLLALLIWYLTAQFLELLDEIGLDADQALREDLVLVQKEMVPAHQRLVNLIFSIGILVVILTSLTRIDMRATLASINGIPEIELSRFSGGEAGALLYFILGLGLLSLSRLMSLQTHWNRLRIPVSSKHLVRQWGMYSLFFLFALAIGVSVLPAGDSLGFFSVLGTLFAFLIGLFVFISQLIIVLLLLLFSLPFFLFGKAPPFTNRTIPPTLPTLPEQAEFPMSFGVIWAFIRSLILWGGLAAISIFALVQFIRQHENILASLRKWRITNWLILAWQWLYTNADQARNSLAQAVATGWKNIRSRFERQRLLPGPGWINLRSLDPRHQIYFFYLAMIRRAEEHGLNRKPSQTPAEHATNLQRALPVASEDIESMTDAFVHARYSLQDVDAKDAHLVKEIWARVRRAMQMKSREERSTKR